MTTFLCCEADMNTASMDTVRGTLVFMYCETCDGRRWSIDGEPARDARALLASAQAHPTRHLVLVRPIAA
jgi:hypothetical protein